MRAHGLLLLISLLGCSANDADFSVEEIIAASAEAFGGSERLDVLSTFRTVTSWGGEAPVVTEIRRPNLMRTEGSSIIIFDGEKAAQLEGPPSEDGPRGPELLDSAVWRDFEIDLAFRFPAFFDFPTEYMGRDTVLGRDVFVLKVALPLGTLVSYFIDTDSFLPVMAVSEVTIDGTRYTPELVYGEFVAVQGILFPSTFRQGWTPESAQDAVVEQVDVNVTFADDHFRIPESIGGNR